MTKLTLNINNLYKENTTDRAEFELMVNEWKQFKKHSIHHVRKQWARFAKYFVRLEHDLKEKGYNVQGVANFIDKYFPSLLPKGNRSFKSDLRYYADNFQDVIAYAEKIGSARANPATLAQQHRTYLKNEREKALKTDKKEPEKTDKKEQPKEQPKDKVINRVQGAKNVQRVVDPLRQGTSKPVTVKESIEVFARSCNMVVEFDNSMGYQDKHKKELIRLAQNLINLLSTSENKPDKTPTNIDQALENSLDKMMLKVVNSM